MIASMFYVNLLPKMPRPVQSVAAPTPLSFLEWPLSPPVVSALPHLLVKTLSQQRESYLTSDLRLKGVKTQGYGVLKTVNRVSKSIFKLTTAAIETGLYSETVALTQLPSAMRELISAPASNFMRSASGSA